MRRVQLLGSLIEQFVRSPAFLYEILRAVKFLLREFLLGIELHNVVARFIDSLFSLADLGVCGIELRLHIAGVHDSKHLAALHEVGLIHKKLEDTAREFRLNVDFIGFEPAVTGSDPRWQWRHAMRPPIAARCPAGDDDDDDETGNDEGPRPSPGFFHRDRLQQLRLADGRHLFCFGRLPGRA